jgi:DNA (cytosine-5)-methyltransferase 1
MPKKRKNESQFTVIDLFAGPGGLSEGFANAGFQIAAQVEKDSVACETLRLRTIFRELKGLNKLVDYWRLVREEITEDEIFDLYPDIQKRCTAQIINREFGSPEHPASSIFRDMDDGLKFLGSKRANILLGGPPCQAFSLVGRSRDPNRMREDNRHFLFEYYLNAIDRFEPDFFVFENVPGILTAETDQGKTIERLVNQFASMKRPYDVAFGGTKLSDLILDSSNYGVPQRRRRLFFIGYRRDLRRRLPSLSELFLKVRDRGVEEVILVGDAIGDLPRLKPGEGSDKWFGRYQQGEELTTYRRLMRQDSEGVVNHRARSHMPSDLERYKFFIDHHKNGNRQTTLFDLESERPDLMPAHKTVDKFVDRFRVQWSHRPASTIMSHISKDGHYYIHYDASQCRSFTVREAARCQSFGDSFVFRGPRTEQFRQVGNAVPPLLAQTIANVLKEELAQLYR